MVYVNRKNMFIKVRIPSCIKLNLTGQKLPSWVGKIAGIGWDAYFIDLPNEMTVYSMGDHKALTHFMEKLLSRELKAGRQLWQKKCFPNSGLLLTEEFITSLNLTIRTTTSLMKYVQSTGEEIAVGGLTFGDIANISKMAPQSTLEFLNAIESFNHTPVTIEKSKAVESKDFSKININNKKNSLKTTNNFKPDIKFRVPRCISYNLSVLDMPDWVENIPGLVLDARFTDSQIELVVKSKEHQYKVIQLVKRFLNTGRIKLITCFPHSTLLLTKDLITSLNLTVRTTTSLMKYVLSTDEEIAISDLTFGVITNFKNMGFKSTLEFLNALESYDPKREEGEKIEIDNKINELIISLRLEDGLNEIFRGDLRFPSLNMDLPLKSYQIGSSLMELLEDSVPVFKDWKYSDKCRLEALLSPLVSIIQSIHEMSVNASLKQIISLQYRGAKEANLNGIYNRFGLNEDGIWTLEECGQLAGITRERIRQIESKIMKGIRSIPGEGKIFMPSFWKAVDTTLKEKYHTIDSIAAKFASLNIRFISIDCILLFSLLLRGEGENLTKHPLPNGSSFLASKDLNLGGIFERMRSLYSRNGVVDLQLAYEGIADRIVSIDYSGIVSVVSSSGKWQSLDSGNQWWIPLDLKDVARNRLVNVGRKMLSICSSVSVDELEDAYKKVATFRNSSQSESQKNQPGGHLIVVPPKSIMLKFFKINSEFTVSGNVIYFNEKLNFREEVNGVEVTLVETILESETGLVSRRDLLEGAIRRGSNEASASLLITYSSLIRRVGLDMYQLVGSSVDAGAVLAHKDSVSKKGKGKRKRVLFHDWHQGYIRIVVKVPEFTSTIVIGAPAPVRPQLVNKKFEVYDDAGETYGTVGVNEEGSVYGMHTYCSGITGVNTQEDDILLMKFDLLDLKVILSIIDIKAFHDISGS